MWLQQLEVPFHKAVRASAAGALDVDDLDHLGGDVFQIERAVGLQHHLISRLQQFLAESWRFILPDWFPSCDLHQSGWIFCRLGHDLGDVHLPARGKGVLGVAIGAAQIAAAQADKDAGPAAERGFALQAVEYLADVEQGKSSPGFSRAALSPS